MTFPASPPAALKFLFPGWFATVMGLSGLSLAWHRAAPLMGEMATGIALVIGALAALVLLVLLGASWVRWQRHPEAWADDLKHPVRHTFVAAVPIAVMLMATVATALLGPTTWGAALWWLGAIGQFGVTLWVLSRWWLGNKAGGLQWASVTPALFIPIVGNVLAPLAGVPLGHEEWAAAQFGLGLMFWPVVLVLLVVRLAVQGTWPERLLPTTFIFIAPPAVVGLSSLQLGAPLLIGWLCWGMALFSLLWVATLAARLRGLAFSVAHWGMSFPLAALAALTLRLATPGSGLLAVLGPVLLALASIIILGLCMGTARGLRDGTLLAPEPVAPIMPLQAG
ncbi:C4-dicarboxylate ABC transporter [Vitreoscilla filiformis]|uniref:C4-dicarboxylate ABC transporter n=1 Tax=Vitreoscilla filiformis TaxID=63 RepID=A0A221KCQ1_VITFI|nr:C4-dicarboxylate ABC transporter [Vitreoscilla filiformis]ASM76808.1 C4-dicarboxylate ABC transporter [Vitreoscilla filiformis]